MTSFLDIRAVMEKSAEALSDNTVKTLENHSEIYAEMVLLLETLNLWTTKLEAFEQNALLKEVCFDLLSSLHIGAQGMYRNAFICLRSALELGLSFVYFVDRNYDYLLWKVNDYDMKWSTLKDNENGLLSKKYFSLFLGDIEVIELINKIKSVYRECSEYVHGKYKYMHTMGEQKIVYQKEKLEQWSSMFINIVKILNVVLVIRFTDCAFTFPEDKKINLREALSEYKLGGII